MSALAAESAMDRALWCQAVNMQFGELKAVKDVSFDVPPATIQGVLGPNGAGKTTLMNLITGHVKGASGEIGLGHRSMRGMPPHTRARLGLARTFQIPHILQHSTVADNLRLGRNLAAVRERTTKRPADQTARAWTRAAERVLELMSGQLPVHRILATPADELSTASWRLLEVLRALMTHPRVLLMDEPFAGLTVDGIRMLTDAMQHVRDETGMSIVLVEHNLSAVFTCVDRLIVMDNGAVVVAGAAGDPRIVAATHALFRNKADPAAAPRPSPVAPSSSITPAVFAAPQAARARGSRLTAGTPEPARSGAPPSLRVIDLCAGYGQLRVVHGVSLSVEASRPVGFIGLNGAGKTTLLRAIAGITRRLNGEVVVDGRQVAANDPAEAIAAGVSSVLERRHLFPSLTVRENLTVAAANGGRRGGDIDSAIEATLEVVPGVGVWLGRRAGSLSGGQQQLVALARALVTRPKVLLLDEPTTGLSPAAVDDVTRALLDVVASGVAVVVAEQNLRFCEQICRYLYAFAGGNTVAEGRAEDVGRLWDAATR